MPFVEATPSHQNGLIEANNVYRNGDPGAMAKAEAVVQAHIAAQPTLMAIPPSALQRDSSETRAMFCDGGRRRRTMYVAWLTASMVTRTHLINAAQHRGRRGAPLARRDDRKYRAIFEGEATQPAGMHRRPNAGAFVR